MLAWFLKAILPGLEDALLTHLFEFIGDLLEKRNLIAQGATAQALKETAKAAAVQGAMNQAGADAPTSKADALKALGDGNA